MWVGALVLRAAERFGARCTGITLSRHQHELAHERIAAAGRGVADVENLRRHCSSTGHCPTRQRRTAFGPWSAKPVIASGDVSRRLRLFIRPRLDVDLPDPGGQGRHLANRHTAPDSRLHLSGKPPERSCSQSTAKCGIIRLRYNLVLLLPRPWTLPHFRLRYSTDAVTTPTTTG